MSDSTIYILVTIAIIFSAFFSASEVAFATHNRIRMKNLAEKGNKKAKLVMKLNENYDVFLSTILIGNNIANILGTSLVTILFVNTFGTDLGATLSTVTFTIIILIFAEVSPKSIAKEYPDKFAMFASTFIQILVYLLLPLNYFFKVWKKFLSLIFKPNTGQHMSEDELLMIVDEVQESGGIDESSSSLIKSAIEFSDLEAVDIYTPRIDIVAISKNQSNEEIFEVFKESGYSRLPVYEDNIDHIIGVINYKDFFSILNENLKLDEVIKNVLYIPKTKKLKDLLLELQQSKSHMAIVIDDYGGTSGLLTLEDILEELVGDIWDEHDDIVEAVKKIDDNHYVVLGNSSIEDFLDTIESDEEPNVLTVNGWIVEKIGTLPVEGKTYEVAPYIFNIIKMDGKRIESVEITIIKENIEENEISN
ncbi:HlyC/CorC family transporter [Acholeplasma granularum]|uniref:HlyC/CorC family transporter n=1 Tax=Acholeplasma granularum TaxID=264635 RepID=UPI00047148A3|nr:hemolysin family protein [Acholeplasma granularum]